MNEDTEETESYVTYMPMAYPLEPLNLVAIALNTVGNLCSVVGASWHALGSEVIAAANHRRRMALKAEQDRLIDDQLERMTRGMS